MNRLKTRLLVTAAAIAVLGTSAQAAELVQKDDAPVTRTDSLAGLSVDSSSDSSETAETAAAEESSTEAESLAPDAQVRQAHFTVWLMLKWERSAPWQSC